LDWNSVPSSVKESLREYQPLLADHDPHSGLL
jgi:hypothetical protein